MHLLPLKLRHLWVVILSAVTILASITPTEAQIRRPTKPAANSKFKVGQKVEFELLGKIRQGEVIEILGTGWYRVRYKEDVNDREWILPPDQAWLPKKPAATAKPAAKLPIRTWTDSTGQFKIEARFSSLQNGNVTLEKADGSKKTLPLDKLSDEDQDAAKKFAAKTPAANPFEGSDDAEAPAAGAESEPLNDEDIVAPDGDWSSVRDVMVDISSKGEFVPDAAEGEPLKQMHSVTMDLTKGAKDRDFSREQPAGLFFDRSHQRLIAASTNDDLHGGMRRGPRLEACDLKTGKSLGVVVIDTGIAPCDLSPDGSSVVCMPTQLVSAFHKRRGIEVWRMGSGGKLAKRWNPNDTRGKEEMFQVDRAMFISRDLLLTVNTMGGKATVWDIDHARAVYTMSVDVNSRPALSTNRKQLAAICSGVICVLDAATGQTLLALTGSGPAGGAAARGRLIARMMGEQLAFRPDGCQLAAFGNGAVQVWDLQKQALVQQIWLSQEGPRIGSDLVEWVDDNHLLVNGGDLVDIAKQIVLWHYDVPGQAHSACAVINGHLCYGSAENDRGSGGMRAGIFFVALPHAEAAQLAAGLSDEKLMALKPGAQVSLSLNFPTANQQDIDAITASYTEQLQSHNVSVVAGAPLTFQATVEPGKTETRTYRIIGRLGGQETVTATTQKCRLALTENGKVLWERATETGGAGFMVSHKEGETLQAAVDRGSQQSVVNFFRNTSLPGSVARQGEHGAYGFSRVTPMGLVAYDPTAEPAAPVRGRLGR